MISNIDLQNFLFSLIQNKILEKNEENETFWFRSDRFTPALLKESSYYVSEKLKLLQYDNIFTASKDSMMLAATAFLYFDNNKKLYGEVQKENLSGKRCVIIENCIDNSEKEVYNKMNLLRKCGCVVSDIVTLVRIQRIYLEGCEVSPVIDFSDMKMNYKFRI